jgi:hypothetical protein
MQKRSFRHESGGPYALRQARRALRARSHLEVMGEIDFEWRVNNEFRGISYRETKRTRGQKIKSPELVISL